MNEENKQETAPASEEVVQPVDVDPEASEKVSRQVPLEALEAERRKRQEAEAQARLYQELAKRAEESKTTEASEQEAEDDYEAVTRGDLKKFHQKLTKEEFAEMKRDIAEETFKDTQPEAIKLINTHLKEILERKPWLADSISRAPNRYARAHEIVNDYMPQVVAQKTQASEAKKIVENSQKPGSPAAVGKSQQLSGADYMKSIAGTNEFREYRKQLLGK